MTYKTKQRELMLAFFESHHHDSFSVEQLFEQLKGEGISLSSIYRNLSELEKDGSVHKVIPQGAREAYYQFVGCEHCRGHIHVQCVECGKTVHLPDEEASKIAKQAKDSLGFELDPTSTVFYGLCKECSAHHSR